jgi:CRP/FNR family transcriptional regulator, anaerobic regulatory protein
MQNLEMNALLQKYRPLFKDLEEGLLVEMFEKGRLQVIAANQTLLRSGQYIRSTFFVLDGSLKLFRENDEGAEYFMYHLHPGEACALSMICDRNSRASLVMAKAETDSLLLVIPLEHTDKWVQQYPTWYHFVIDTYRKRYEEQLETIDQIAFQNMDVRLEHYLIRHQKAQNSKVLEMTNTQIAQELNSSREVISRLMKKLAEQGKVRLLKNGIQILKI